MNHNPVHGRSYPRGLGNSPVDPSADSLGTRSINVPGPGENLHHPGRSVSPPGSNVASGYGVSKRSPTQDASTPHQTHGKNPAALWGKAKSKREDYGHENYDKPPHDDRGNSTGKGDIKSRNKEPDDREEKKEEASSAASRVKRSEPSVPRTNGDSGTSGKGNIKTRNKEEDAKEGKDEEDSMSSGAFGKRFEGNIKTRDKKADVKEGTEEEASISSEPFGKRSDPSPLHCPDTSVGRESPADGMTCAPYITESQADIDFQNTHDDSTPVTSDPGEVGKRSDASVLRRDDSTKAYRSLSPAEQDKVDYDNNHADASGNINPTPAEQDEYMESHNVEGA